MANSFKDPYWTNLSANTEKLLKLPTGLLQNIVMHGERSNADQVSSAGARTVYQITPTTRNLVLKKYGVDAFLNPNNAAMAAGLLLKEGLQRNKGNIEAAIGEYHGGTDRKNWGPVNQAYRKRVMSAQGGGLTEEQPQSTFQRVKANYQQEQAPAIAKVYDLYKTGGLNPQQKKDFEDDVKAGKIMLPEGAKLLGKTNAQVVTLPQSVSDAYASGKLNSQQRADLEADIKAGKVKLPVATKNQSSLPDFNEQGTIVQQATEQGILPPQAPDPTLLDKAMGVGDATLTGLSAATTGTIGYIGGTAQGLADTIAKGQLGSQEGARNIARYAQKGAEAGTRTPTTPIGQGILEDAEDVLGTLPPTLGGGLGMQTAALGRAAIPQAITAAQRTAQAAAPIVERAGKAVQRPVQAVANATRSGVDNLRDAVGLGRTVDTTSEPANIGAAQVDQATVRQALSQELPYPPQLTEGQLSRDPGQLKFEVETSKDADLGAPLRQRQEEQHQVMQQNIDAFIDMTGAKATNMRDVGLAVDSALQKQMQADKNRVRVAYAKADKSEEAQTPVDLMQPVKSGDNEAMSVIDYLNSQPELPTTPILTSAKRTAESIGIARRGENGVLIPNNPTIKQMEKWRQEINANTNQEAPNIRQTAILKDMIDQHVGPVEGALYKAARKERQRMAKHWESNAVIKDLTMKKNGTEDRRVALEDVQKRIIHDGSLDDLRVARRALMTSGEEGKQAWKDIQGQTLQEIKDAATSGVAPDAQGNQMISPAALNKAVKRLDDDGKLDYIFGKQGAEKIRALNDISKTLFTQPASAAINHSNTAATLMAALDITMSGLSGFPAPVASALRIATKHIKDNKVRARVQKALNPKGKSI
ncbi:transglycosylase SLT domain-containing protein [Acinetobacter baumannii]|nr:transglycosylase SLT domain-containing protein [Acinetobacter baumannii]